MSKQYKRPTIEIGKQLPNTTWPSQPLSRLFTFSSFQVCEQNGTGSEMILLEDILLQLIVPETSITLPQALYHLGNRYKQLNRLVIFLTFVKSITIQSISFQWLFAYCYGQLPDTLGMRLKTKVPWRCSYRNSMSFPLGLIQCNFHFFFFIFIFTLSVLHCMRFHSCSNPRLLKISQRNLYLVKFCLGTIQKAFQKTLDSFI